MSHPAKDHEIDGTEPVDGLAPGIDGKQDLETELDETEKTTQLPEGEFRKNSDEQAGEIDQKPAAMRSPPSNYDADNIRTRKE